MQKITVYFSKPGPNNTTECLKIVKNAIKDFNYRHAVVASTTGRTGELFASSFDGEHINLVIVTHSHGFKEPNTSELPAKIKEKIIASGAKIFTGTMITHSLETALAKKFSGVYPTLLVAQSLRRFGEGAKVCCEIVMMAADAGLIPEGEDVISGAGKGHETRRSHRSCKESWQDPAGRSRL